MHLTKDKAIVSLCQTSRNVTTVSESWYCSDDCYKVSIESSILDAAFIPDVANNGKRKITEVIGCFLAWPKDLVVMQEEVHIYMCFFNLHIYNSSYLIQCLIQASFVYYRLHHQLRYQKLVKKILDQKSQGSENRWSLVKAWESNLTRGKFKRL